MPNDIEMEPVLGVENLAPLEPSDGEFGAYTARLQCALGLLDQYLSVDLTTAEELFNDVLQDLGPSLPILLLCTSDCASLIPDIASEQRSDSLKESSWRRHERFRTTRRATLTLLQIIEEQFHTLQSRLYECHTKCNDLTLLEKLETGPTERMLSIFEWIQSQLQVDGADAESRSHANEDGIKDDITDEARRKVLYALRLDDILVPHGVDLDDLPTRLSTTWVHTLLQLSIGVFTSSASDVYESLGGLKFFQLTIQRFEALAELFHSASQRLSYARLLAYSAFLKSRITCENIRTYASKTAGKISNIALAKRFKALESAANAAIPPLLDMENYFATFTMAKDIYDIARSISIPFQSMLRHEACTQGIPIWLTPTGSLNDKSNNSPTGTPSEPQPTVPKEGDTSSPTSQVPNPPPPTPASLSSSENPSTELSKPTNESNTPQINIHTQSQRQQRKTSSRRSSTSFPDLKLKLGAKDPYLKGIIQYDRIAHMKADAMAYVNMELVRLNALYVAFSNCIYLVRPALFLNNSDSRAEILRAVHEVGLDADFANALEKHPSKAATIIIRYITDLFQEIYASVPALYPCIEHLLTCDSMEPPRTYVSNLVDHSNTISTQIGDLNSLSNSLADVRIFTLKTMRGAYAANVKPLTLPLPRKPPTHSNIPTKIETSSSDVESALMSLSMRNASSVGYTPKSRMDLASPAPTSLHRLLEPSPVAPSPRLKLLRSATAPIDIPANFGRSSPLFAFSRAPPSPSPLDAFKAPHNPLLAYGGFGYDYLRSSGALQGSRDPSPRKFRRSDLDETENSEENSSGNSPGRKKRPNEYSSTRSFFYPRNFSPLVARRDAKQKTLSKVSTFDSSYLQTSPSSERDDLSSDNEDWLEASGVEEPVEQEKNSYPLCPPVGEWHLWGRYPSTDDDKEDTDDKYGLTDDEFLILGPVATRQEQSPMIDWELIHSLSTILNRKSSEHSPHDGLISHLMLGHSHHTLSKDQKEHSKEEEAILQLREHAFDPPPYHPTLFAPIYTWSQEEDHAQYMNERKSQLENDIQIALQPTHLLSLTLRSIDKTQSNCFELLHQAATERGRMMADWLAEMDSPPMLSSPLHSPGPSSDISKASNFIRLSTVSTTAFNVYWDALTMPSKLSSAGDHRAYAVQYVKNFSISPDSSGIGSENESSAQVSPKKPESSVTAPQPHAPRPIHPQLSTPTGTLSVAPTSLQRSWFEGRTPTPKMQTAIPPTVLPAPTMRSVLASPAFGSVVSQHRASLVSSAARVVAVSHQDIPLSSAIFQLPDDDNKDYGEDRIKSPELKSSTPMGVESTFSLPSTPSTAASSHTSPSSTNTTPSLSDTNTERMTPEKATTKPKRAKRKDSTESGSPGASSSVGDAPEAVKKSSKHVVISRPLKKKRREEKLSSGETEQDSSGRVQKKRRKKKMTPASELKTTDTEDTTSPTVDEAKIESTNLPQPSDSSPPPTVSVVPPSEAPLADSPQKSQNSKPSDSSPAQKAPPNPHKNVFARIFGVFKKRR